MTRSDVWAYIKNDTRRLHAGEKVHTALLGWVYGRAYGEMVPTIPIDMKSDALSNGFRVVSANVDGTYTLEKL